ncbi:MAG TPA: winged helix-turn-helix transcriptional regulator [Saprospiraceae bacterium]|nr:winged helix-turn-helix transcriptional regulator [Saprospiraceae bacterium]
MDKLDELDYAILKLLIQDAKTPYTEVGKLLNISSGTVHVRMRKLEQAGIVLGSTLAINHEELGFKMCAFLGIDLVRDDLHDDVVTRLKEIRQILAAYFVSGPHTILARIVCHDKAELTELLRSSIYPIEGIQRVEIYVSLTEYFSRSVSIAVPAG